jgi:hypothetical protein
LRVPAERPPQPSRAPVTDHAIGRWLERVGAESYAAALSALAAFLASGSASSRAPRWHGSQPGGPHRYVTNSACGGVCVVTHNGCAITVVTRQIAKQRKGFSSDYIAVQRRKAMA